MLCVIKVKVRVKQYHYRPGQALRVPGGWGSQISRHSAHESDKVVSPTHRPPLPPRKYSWYSFLLEAEAIVRPDGLCKWKIPVTQSGIEPATFRLIAQCPNQLRHHVSYDMLAYFFFIAACAPWSNLSHVPYTRKCVMTHMYVNLF